MPELVCRRCRRLRGAPEGCKAGARADHDYGTGRVRRQPEVWVFVDVHRNDVSNLARCTQIHNYNMPPEHAFNNGA